MASVLWIVLMCSLSVVILPLHSPGVDAWTGEIRGRVACDVCGDSSIGPEDHFLEGIFRLPPCNSQNLGRDLVFVLF